MSALLLAYLTDVSSLIGCTWSTPTRLPLNLLQQLSSYDIVYFDISNYLFQLLTLLKSGTESWATFLSLRRFCIHDRGNRNPLLGILASSADSPKREDELERHQK